MRVVPERVLVTCDRRCPHYSSRTIFCGHDYDITWCERAKREIVHDQFFMDFPVFCPLKEAL